MTQPSPSAEERPCIFCDSNNPRVIAHEDGAIARADRHPVTPGHTLIIPTRHVESYGDLTPEEISQCHVMLNRMRQQLQTDDPTIVAFNIGINDGVIAGQSIMHVHMHLIPRRKGDVDDPRGGIRHLLPDKGFYHDKVKTEL